MFPPGSVESGRGYRKTGINVCVITVRSNPQIESQFKKVKLLIETSISPSWSNNQETETEAVVKKEIKMSE